MLKMLCFFSSSFPWQSGGLNSRLVEACWHKIVILRTCVPWNLRTSFVLNTTERRLAPPVSWGIPHLQHWREALLHPLISKGKERGGESYVGRMKDHDHGGEKTFHSQSNKIVPFPCKSMKKEKQTAIWTTLYFRDRLSNKTFSIFMGQLPLVIDTPMFAMINVL